MLTALQLCPVLFLDEVWKPLDDQFFLMDYLSPSRSVVEPWLPGRGRLPRGLMRGWAGWAVDADWTAPWACNPPPLQPMGNIWQEQTKCRKQWVKMHSVRVMQQHNESIWPHRKADKQAHVTAHLLCDVNMTWNNHCYCMYRLSI